MNEGTATFIRLAKHRIKFSLFLLTKLPSAYFAGVRIREIDASACTASVRYKWFSKNPFRSTYFACLAMAAEMSTGALALAHLFHRKPAVSMLVLKIEGDYFKKATGRTDFRCVDGERLRETIEEAVASGEAKTFRAQSVGRNKDNETVAEFFITWSFKARSQH